MIAIGSLTKNSLTVSRYTFLEVYKSKVMINVVFLGLVVVLLSYVASEFTYGVPQKVALEFGLGVVTISSMAIAILMGSTLLSSEIDNRTAYLVLSRPISRQSFMLGKFLGMAQILFIDIAILGSLTLAFFAILGGQIDMFMISSLFFIFLESLIILLVVIFFTLFNNVTLSIIFTIAVYFSGHSLQKIILFLYKKDSLMAFVLVIVSYFIPNLDKLNIKENVIYQQNIQPVLLAQLAGYGLFCILILLAINMFIFSRKNLD